MHHRPVCGFLVISLALLYDLHNMSGHEAFLEIDSTYSPPAPALVPNQHNEADPLGAAMAAVVKLRAVEHSGYVEAPQPPIPQVAPVHDVVTEPHEPRKQDAPAKVIDLPVEEPPRVEVVRRQPQQPQEPQYAMANNVTEPALSDNGALLSFEEFKRANRKELMGDAERFVCIERAQAGDQQAMGKLWQESIKFARHYAFNYQSPTLELEDKIQICLAVVPGVIARYDRAKGASYGSMVTTRMMGALKDADRKELNAAGLSRHENQRIADALKSDDPAGELHEIAKAGIPVRDLIKHGTVVSAPDSLENLQDIFENGEAASGYMPRSTQDIVAEAQARIDRERLKELLHNLPERERDIVVHVNGLFEARVKKLGELGKMYGISESRVCQIHSKVRRYLAKNWHDDRPGIYVESENDVS